LSGVVAGIVALTAAIIVYLKYQSTYIHRYGFEISDNLSDYMIEDKLSFISFIVVLALLTLFFAIGSGFYFTYRKSIEKGYKLIGHASRLLCHMKALEDLEYVKVDKRFVGRKPKTSFSISELGRLAFKDHISNLEKILRDN
jgi:uncharacterized membrane protein